MPPDRPLATPRLALRPVARSDVAELSALLANPGVFRFLLDGAPAPPALVRELVAASEAIFRDTGVGLFLATDREGGGVAGLAGFRRAEIGGIELVCALWPRCWKRGLAGEACRACLAFAFDEARLDEVLAGADAPNAASLRLIARLGFEPLGETPGAFGAIRWFVLRRMGWPGSARSGKA